MHFLSLFVVESCGKDEIVWVVARRVILDNLLDPKLELFARAFDHAGAKAASLEDRLSRQRFGDAFREI